MRSLLPALLATLLLACKATEPIPEDPWLEEAPDMFGAGWVRASGEDIWPIDPAEIPSVVQSLEAQPWRVISAAEAERLTTAGPHPGKVPHLLRGICIGCSKGDFSLLQKGTEFAVHYGGVAIIDTRVRRWPVVAWLDRSPTEVYVSCAVTH